MLPQIALGHSQSSINTVHFENEVLHLSEIMIPPYVFNIKWRRYFGQQR